MNTSDPNEATFGGQPLTGRITATPTSAGDSVAFTLPERPPKPTAAELLARAADEAVSLPLRMAAAEGAALELRVELEHKCAAIFPDFYWPHSSDDAPFGFEGPGYVNCRPPQWRTFEPDGELTEARIRALTALGFTHFLGEPLGVAGPELSAIAVPLGDEGCT